MRVMYRAGTVYSDSNRFATAMLTDAGTVTWLGDELSAENQQADRVVDLGGALLTPAFADAGEPAESAEVLASRGVGAVIDRGPWAQVVSTGQELRDLPPGNVAVLDPRILPEDTDLAEASSSGLPLALGTAIGQDADPWRMVQHALARGLSARAGFLAATRGAWRAGALGLAGGRLEVGAAASFVVWHSAPLGVQVADVARSAWSVDERSGLPPLPVLAGLADPAWLPPRPRLTVIDGVVAHEG